MTTYAFTIANLKRARSRISDAPACDCCHVGVIAIKEAIRCVERVREIERLEAEALAEAEADAG